MSDTTRHKRKRKNKVSLRRRMMIRAIETIESITDTLVARQRLVRIVLSLCMGVWFLYGPVCAYYRSWRDMISSQYSIQVLEEQNRELTDDIKSMYTRERIEDLARSHGYVEPGEVLVVVNGLEDDDDKELVKTTERIVMPVPWWKYSRFALLG